ncbi:acetyl-CoA C-acyltransferase [Corynebacterium propinquum]|uniref:acetyl-CoA C-acyltransferase n=1 Tax=Corynebacterium propinquum TaxID=43769 RepID=UPI00037AFF4F|nr:acetyl-CoA C-acyltransferase [Corynebacterium propinquum]MCG7230924.1 acetyl-CoA C-acyltransferase [Corynebacterium propinquum]MCT1818391.1 acetyl-CoA C-acyltransferase [Corynebacterium propinquum]MDK4234646.1 acetyl-CoA C-acyltransferase [Corynebacterium propinquum]MDK4238673.1 acetyl-CoA C-acyltransferase [Corynebacterium propinquum]MDK4292634.1 acetyl-CoA C-acyltransferase [Corynebacterium propinquum]
MSEIYIANAARLPIGKNQGSLAKLSPTEMGTIAAKEVIARAGVDPAAIDSVVAGNVVPTTPSDAYLSRKIGINSGLKDSSIAFNVNRLCGSGVQAIVSAGQQIMSGDAELALAAGVEHMSSAPYSVKGMRTGGLKMGDGVLEDWLLGTLACPFGTGHMGVTAENVAEEYGISRERQDEFAAESQRRAAAARDNGVHKEEIVPVTLNTRQGEITFDFDEHVRETTPEALAKLKPVFRKDGTVTPGNSSGINDGAAALLLGSESALNQHGTNPLGRVVSWGIAGVDPTKMGLGPIAAVPKALQKAGLSLSDIDLIESNEAFAAQAIAVQDELGFDPDKTNVHGGAVAHGHPVGASGAILTVKILHHLRATGKKYGLVTMCIGGGQGIALIVEAV